MDSRSSHHLRNGKTFRIARTLGYSQRFHRPHGPLPSTCPPSADSGISSGTPPSQRRSAKGRVNCYAGDKRKGQPVRGQTTVAAVLEVPSSLADLAQLNSEPSSHRFGNALSE